MNIIKQIIHENEIRDLYQNKLKNPGDYIIYTPLNDEEVYIVAYYKDIVFSTRAEIYQPENKFHSFKIKKSEIRTVEGLGEKVANGLLIIVAWDFDQTITAIHTWPGEDARLALIRQADNRRFLKDTNAVFQKLANKQNIVQIIASNQYTAIIQNYLNLWGISDLFASVQGREVVHASSLGKLACFINAYKLIKLDKLAFIDIVGCYLIDDDLSQKDYMEAQGVHFIPVTNNNQHLLTVNKEFDLQLSLELQQHVK